MEKIYKKARAKINLFLNVLNKKNNNYHNLETVFQKINFYDELFIEKTDTNKLEIITNFKEIKLQENIIYKAYLLLKAKYSIIKGIKVKLIKKIPIQAGLGGGSTDCANFILAINKLYDLNLTELELIKIGEQLGADVCACYFNQAVKAEGIGERITKINTRFNYYILIIKPDIMCSTKDMFKRLDKKYHTIKKRNIDLLVKSLETENLDLLCDNLYNVFEEVIKEKNIINKLKKELKDNGAVGVLMTGSGACVYGIFSNKASAKKAFGKLKKKYEVYICTSYNIRKG